MEHAAQQYQSITAQTDLNQAESSAAKVKAGETVIQLQLEGPPAAQSANDAPLASLSAMTPHPTSSPLTWSAVIDQVLTSDAFDILLHQIILRLQSDSAFTQPIIRHLFQQLVSHYRQQIAIAVSAEGLSAVDLTKPQFRLHSVNGSKVNQKLDVILDDGAIQRYLETSLTQFFAHSHFRQAFGRFLSTHLSAWAADNLDSSIGALNPAKLDPASVDQTISRAAAELLHHLRHNLDPLSDKITLLGSIYSLEIAQMVTHSLDLPNCSLVRLETLMGLTVTPPVTIDDALDLPRVAPVPTAIPIASSIRAQLRPDLWQRDREVAVFQYRSKNNPANYIEHYITNPGDIALLPWEAAEQIINKFGFDTVKLQMIFAARTMDEVEPWNSTFRLRATDIVQLLGWDRNHNTSLPEKRSAIANAAHALSCLLVKSVWIEGRGRRRVDASTPVGRMWDVLVDPHGQIDWVTGKIERPDEVYVTVTPGLWTKHFLNRAGHQAKAALHQFGYLARDILQIDPYHHEMALRLAIQLTLDARVRVHNQHPYEYQVIDLLKDVMPSTEITRALEDKYKARDLKNRWNRALTLLTSLGWQIEYDSNTYPDWLQPNSKARRPSDWRRIKLIERLLQAQLVIRPPQPIPQLLAQVKSPRRLKPRRSRPALPSQDMTGDAVREGRQSRGWSRKELGGFLGVSADYVGKLERGDRIITPQLQKRLRRLLSPP